VVDSIKPRWLNWRLFAYEVEGFEGDHARWREELDVDPETPILPSKPHSSCNKAEVNHLRIEIGSANGQHRLNQEFYEVVLLAAVAKLWRWAWPR
jgi:hypothetical protein